MTCVEAFPTATVAWATNKLRANPFATCQNKQLFKTVAKWQQLDPVFLVG